MIIGINSYDDMDYTGYYTTFDIIKKLGIKRERLKNWIMSGYIIPAFQSEIGQGKKSYFTKWQLYVIKLFEYFVENGISRQKAAEMTFSCNALIIDEIRRMNPKIIAVGKKDDSEYGMEMIFDKDIKNIRYDQYRTVLVVNFDRIKNQVEMHNDEWI